MWAQYRAKMNNWTRLKGLYVSDKLAKGELSTPQMRLSATNELEKIIALHLPQFYKQPKFLRKIPKDEFTQMVQTKKGANLTGIEKAVINGLYKFLPEL